MADRRFNLLLAAVFTGGALPIQPGCQQPGIAPGPHFFLSTFIIVLLWASLQLAYPRQRSGGSFPGLDKQPKSHRPAADRKAMGIRQGCSGHAAAGAQPEGQRRGRWPGGCRAAGSGRKQVCDLNFLEKESEGYIPFKVHHAAGEGGDDV